MYCHDVEGWFSQDDYSAYVEIVSNFSDGNFAEIGCWKGRSLCSIMPTLLQKNYKNIYAIDHWMGSISERETAHKEATHSDVYSQFYKNLENHGFKDKFKVVKMDSVQAAAEFEDGFFDVVFIDGDHDYEGICRDLDAWAPKIKPTGILCGHDGHHQPIIKALLERFPKSYILNGSVWIASV